ncbi:hypothetical protein G6F46_015811 [Rhizopus delemar]|nr:hypothetical protein G6F46_015811 [Rhizopus delemar]
MPHPPPAPRTAASGGRHADGPAWRQAPGSARPAGPARCARPDYARTSPGMPARKARRARSAASARGADCVSTTRTR